MSKSENETVLSNIFSTVKESVYQINSLMPDSILFGSLLLYFLTHNLAFGTFFGFIAEMSATHSFISWLVRQNVNSSVLGDKRIHPNSADKFIKCRVGYKTPYFDYTKILARDPYPSYGIFSITSIGTYLGLAMNAYSDTLNTMDQATKSTNKRKTSSEWNSRCITAYILIFVVVLSFIIVRWSFCKESIKEIGISFILAIVTGIVFFYINMAIAGKESMNFLGLPYIVSKESKGDPIYICAKDGNTELK